MAKVHFAVYDIATEKVLRWGSCEEYDLPKQARTHLGEAVVEATADTVAVAEVNIDPIKQVLRDKIDAAAQAIVAPGQKPIYARKLAEANAYPKGATPMLSAEADSLGIKLADLVKRVLAKAAAQDAIEIKVELARRQANIAVSAAETVGAAHVASLVDWSSITDDSEIT